MKIPITGTEGDIGARLAPWLRARGHEARRSACQGAAELRRLFERIEFRAFNRLEQLKYLQRTKQINDDLRWSPR